MTSLISLIMSAILVGFFTGLIGVVLSVIGLRRSKTLGGRRRGAAITGIVLGVLAMLASVGFGALYLQALNGGPVRELGGVSTRSTNIEFPPQDDIIDTTCESSDGGALGLAIIELENKSPGRSNYAVTVSWDTPGGNVLEDVVRSDFVEPGETETLRLFESTGSGVPESCRVTEIERTGLTILNN